VMCGKLVIAVCNFVYIVVNVMFLLNNNNNNKRICIVP